MDKLKRSNSPLLLFVLIIYFINFTLVSRLSAVV
jgi:hypothetical protein